MEDSMEDFIRMHRNTRPKEPTVKISKEVLITVQRKRECEAHALKIVQFLIEGKLRPETFLRCLKHINQDQYQDIVEERSITRLCGYSLCGKKISDMPKQKYIISVKANKIYEITDRKNYCSNFCYKASLHIKSQIETSPLWLRNPNESPNFYLLPACEVGVPGEEIDQGIAKPVIEPPVFTSVSQFTEVSLDEVRQMEVTKHQKKIKKSRRYSKLSNMKPSMNTINENEEESEYRNDEDESEESYAEEIVAAFDDSSEEEAEGRLVDDMNSKLRLEPIDENSPLEDVHYRSKEANVLNRKPFDSSKARVEKGSDSKPKRSPKQANDSEKLAYLINKLKINNEPKTKLIDAPVLSPTRLERPVSQNVKINVNQEATISKSKIKPKDEKLKNKAKRSTMDASGIKESVVGADTAVNEEKSCDILENLRKCFREWLTLETYIYIYGESKIKQILNEKKLDEYFDKLRITDLQTTQQLKYMNICKRLQLQELAEDKFDSALIGKTLKPLPDYKKLKEEGKELDLKVKSFYGGVMYEKPDTNFPTKPVRENRGEVQPAVLPLVDMSSQNALRRKVFINSINKLLRILINELKLGETCTLSDVHNIIKTFKLQAHNIVFKPATWNLISVVLINMLSLKDENIRNQLINERSVEHINLILSKYQGIDEFLKELLHIVEDVDTFIEFYITNSDAV